jgi:hypothetical protein
MKRLQIEEYWLCRSLVVTVPSRFMIGIITVHPRRHVARRGDRITCDDGAILANPPLKFLHGGVDVCRQSRHPR